MIGILKLSDKERVNKKGVKFFPWLEPINVIVNTNSLSKIDCWAKVNEETCELMEIFGPVGDKDTEIKAMLYRFEVKPCRYPGYRNIQQDITTDNTIEVFTVDNNGTQDMDDALSVNMLGPKHYIIGVHITDITDFISDDLYDWAMSRGTSVYYDETLCMLPPDLTYNSMSLTESKTRKCITLWIEWKDNVIINMKHENTIVVNTKKLSYDDFEKCLPREYSILKEITNEENADDIVSWTMIQYNKYFANYLGSHNILYRTTRGYTKDKVVHDKLNFLYTHMTSPIRRFADLYNQMCYHNKQHDLTNDHMTTINDKVSQVSHFYYHYHITEIAYKSLEKPIEIKIEQTDNDDYVYAYLPQKRVRIPTHESYYENNIGPTGDIVKVWGIIKNGKAALRILNEQHTFNIDDYISPTTIEAYSKFKPCDEADLKEMTETFLGYDLDPFQINCLKVISKGDDVLGMAPTGSGKTAVAVIGITSAFSQDKRVIYTSPIKALSNEKYNSFYKSLHGRVTLLTGDIKTRCTKLGGDGIGELLIMTAEILKNKLSLSQTTGVIDPDLVNVSVVIQDEVHYINDPERGPVWEETMMLLDSEIQLISLSATLSNAETFCDWLCQRRPTQLVQRNDRHVPLFLGKIEEGQFTQLFSTHDNKPLQNDTFNINTSYPELVRNLIKLNKCPAIIFCMSRKGCVDAAHSITNNLMISPKPVKVKDYPDDLWESLQNEHQTEVVNYERKWKSLWNTSLQKYTKELESIPGWSKEINLLKHGVGYHHAGMLPLHREFVEQLFQNKMLKVVFATETLGVGINMPARTTVFTQLDKPTNKENKRWLRNDEFWQMAGRSGRRGMDTKGYVIYYPMKRVCPFNVFKNMVESQPLPTSSKLKIDESFVLRNMNNGQETLLKSLLYTEYKKELEAMESKIEHQIINQDSIEIIKLQEKLEQKFIKLTKKQLKATRVRLKELVELNKNIDIRYTKEYISKIKDIDNHKKWFDNQWHTSVERLTKRGFINDGVLTEKGYVASQLNDNESMSRAELLCSNMLDNVSFTMLVCNLAKFIQFGSIQNEEELPQFEINNTSSKLMYLWCSTKDINKLTYFIPVYQLGNFVKLVLRIISFLEETEKILLGLEKYKLRNELIHFQDKLFFGIITNQSLYV
jgi:replicative superfamily II helicase